MITVVLDDEVGASHRRTLNPGTWHSCIPLFLTPSGAENPRARVPAPGPQDLKGTAGRAAGAVETPGRFPGLRDPSS